MKRSVSRLANPLSHCAALLRCILLSLCACLPHGALASDRSVSFNLSTSKTFAPGEQPTVQLYTHNVDALEFRVYRVSDPARFLENLRELHSFGTGLPSVSGEQIDERTWIERFHDWKSNLWYTLRSWLRHQFSHEARESLRDRQATVSRKSRIVSAAEFAQIPVLNSNQLVARWRQQVPATFISNANKLAVPRLEAGLYLLEATDGNFKAYTLINVTPWALLTRTGPNQVLAFLVDRATGAPIAGATVSAGFGQQSVASGTTSAVGTAPLQVQGSPAQQDNFWVVASQGNNVAITTPGSYALNAESTQSIASYFFTERPVYRPGDTVHWKAILREKRDNLLTLPAMRTATVTITDETDKTLLERTMPVSADGTVNGDFAVPKNGALGFYGVSILVGDTTIHGNFHVEEYRKPEYRVSVAAATKTTLLGATMPVTIDSRYFFGEPVANAAVKYRVYQERHYWWGGEGDDDAADNTSTNDDDAGSGAGYAGDVNAEKTGRLNANGKLVVQIPTTVDGKGFVHPDYDYTVEAGVTDAANREITGRGRFLATYGTFHINVESINYGVHPGDAARFNVIAVDYENKPVSTAVHVQLAYRHYVNGKTETINGDAMDLQTDAAGRATGQLTVKQTLYSSAALLATAKAVVPGTRDVTDEGSIWIMGANVSAADYGSDSGTARLLADKKSYAPGDTAHLSLVSEVEGFHALIVTTGSTQITRELMSSEGKTLSFDVPITAASQPNLTVDALFLRDNVVYQASKSLSVPPSQQELQVTVTPVKDTFQPGESASYDVTTRDAAGHPVRADLSVGVVDEAIYSLYPDSSGNMVARLYPKRFSYTQVDSSLMYYFSGEAGTKSPMLAVRNTRFRPLAQVKPGNEAKPRVRKAFPDTAFWAPDVHTDAAGHARVALTFPDSLTTWRATVHAISATSQAGSAISRVLVRKNVLVRMGTPRFLRKGDELVVPVIVHNYLETPVQATLSLSAKGLNVLSGASSATQVASKGEGTATWRLGAPQVGTATLTASAIAPAESDALELPIPVLPAGVAKTLAQSGTVQANAGAATADFTFPANTDAAAHSLHVELSPSIAGSLFSALDYLTSFPYGCTEQTMSSFLPNVIVQQAMQRLGVPSRIDADALRSKMNAGLVRLKDYQHEDGGWGWWKEDNSLVFMTAYVVSGLGQAGDAIPLRGPENYGYMLQRGRQYLHAQLRAHPNMRPELRATVVYALAQGATNNDDADLKAALEAQWSRRSDLDAESLAMTGLAMLQVHDDRVAQIARLLQSKAQRAGDLVHWTGNYIPLLDTSYQNDTEATAFALRLLSRTDPASPLLSGAAQWLMLARNGGVYWESTEQTAMVIFGMTEYLAASKELQGDFTAQILVNGSTVAQRHFAAADILRGASLTADVDAAHLQPGRNAVQIRRADGSGRIYWSSTPTFYSTDKDDYQQGKMTLNLTRDYYRLQPVQKDGKVLYSMQPIGNSTVNIGDVLAVHEAINGSPMRYMMLEDPIAAGTEFLGNTDAYPVDGRSNIWYEWYTRREFRDDRAVFFVADFTGRQEVFYLVKVVNPGTFHVSPARVEPMYQHGVQATSDEILLTVPAPAAGAMGGTP